MIYITYYVLNSIKKLLYNQIIYKYVLKIKMIKKIMSKYFRKMRN